MVKISKIPYNYKNKKCRTFSYGDGVKFTSYKCEQDTNCYFKQLQRLKQENEELKKYVECMDKPEIKVIDSKVALQNLKYKQALEEIREISKNTGCLGLIVIIDEVLNEN